MTLSFWQYGDIHRSSLEGASNNSGVVKNVDFQSFLMPHLRGLGQLGAADSAMPIRRDQLGAANSTSGQFGVDPTRRRRFGAWTFRRQ